MYNIVFYFAGRRVRVQPGPTKPQLFGADVVLADAELEQNCCDKHEKETSTAV